MREPDPEGYSAGTDASIWLYPHGTSWARALISVESGADRSAVAIDPGESTQVISLPTGTKIWIAAGITDMRRGFDGLSAQVQTVLHEQPFSVTSSFSAVEEATSLNAFGSMAMVFVFLPSV